MTSIVKILFLQNHYIEYNNLTEKYRGYEGRLKSYSKSIADCSGVKVEVEVKRNKTVQFVVIGGSKGVAKALELIKKEFEISEVILCSYVLWFDLFLFLHSLS